jgi:hypothetical protein
MGVGLPWSWEGAGRTPNTHASVTFRWPAERPARVGRHASALPGLVSNDVYQTVFGRSKRGLPNYLGAANELKGAVNDFTYGPEYRVKLLQDKFASEQRLMAAARQRMQGASR